MIAPTSSRLNAGSTFAPTAGSFGGKRAKASEVVVDTWKIPVAKLEEVQAAGKVLSMNGFITDISSNEKFNSASSTVSLAILIDDWRDFAQMYFPPLAELPTEILMDNMTAFRVPVKFYSNEYVTINFKAFPLVLGDPVEWADNPLVTIVFNTTVYAPFGDIKIAGVSFKAGHIAKVAPH